MLTLLFPCTTRKPLPGLKQVVDRTLFAQVFRENNVALRNKFYADPLVKHLWSQIFVVECEETCVAHLRRIRSQAEQGEIKFERLLKDMGQFEVDFNFKILPDSARNEENTRVFTKEEEYEDMVKNIQYNKKQAK